MSLNACRLGPVLCAASVCLIALASPAAAGDLLPAPEATQWSGFYVGGQLGGAWSDSDWQYDNHNWFNTIGPELVGTRFGFDGSGVIGGGQGGVNYQSGAFVCSASKGRWPAPTSRTAIPVRGSRQIATRPRSACS
jgi:outer membrane immunogenic protein